MDISAILIYIIVALVSTLVYFVRKRLRYWKDRGIPYDEPSLVMGNLKGFRTTNHFKDCFERTYKKFKGTGPFVGFFFFQKPTVLVLDMNLVKNILIKDFSNFTDRGLYYNEKDDPLTGHLFALDGVKWRKLRNKLSPTFTSGKMKFMFPTVVDVGRQLIDVFGETVEKSSTIEIKELLSRFTADVIGTCAFGLECNSLRDPNAEFHVMGKRMFVERRHGGLIDAFIESFHNLARYLGLRIIPDDIHNFYMKIVRDTVTYREMNGVQRNDFMNLLIDLKNKKSIANDHDDYQQEDLSVDLGLTMEELAAQAFVFFLAGFETSSTTMCFALYELAMHQDIQEKLRQEIVKVLKDHQNQFTYDCMKEMEYLEQVISETLRMYPIVTQLARRASNDYIVDSNTRYVIPKDVQALIPVWSIHHDPDIYPNPETFDPERFSIEEIKKRGHSAMTWLAFGDGPRNCIGLRFGQMQTRIGLALLLKNFRFSISEKTVIPMKFDVRSPTLSSKDGVYLKVEKL